MGRACHKVADQGVRLPRGRRCGCCGHFRLPTVLGKKKVVVIAIASQFHLAIGIHDRRKSDLLAMTTDNEILKVVYPSLQYSFDLEELSPMLFDVALGVVRHLIEIR